ncbi:MAG: hypothetical protein OHK0021_03290 [Bryobacter sp.]
MRLLLTLVPMLVLAADIPKNAKPLFNGKDLTGWHISESNHHGNTKAWTVENGIVKVMQDKPGNGGILLTNKTYKNFELYAEVKPDWGCDGGIFLWSNEKGEAYQVMLDYLEGGNMGGIHGEKLPEIANKPGQPPVGTGQRMDRDWQKHWKKDDWNQLKIRIVGTGPQKDIPHIQVWINGQQVVDWTDNANHAKTGMAGGMIALQAHRSDPTWKSQRWVAGGAHRHRNLYIVELP